MTGEEKRSRLEKALEYGGSTHSVEDVVAMVKEGKAQFWSWKDGSIITELHEYPRMKTVNLWLVSGNLGDCLTLEEDVMSWAHMQGCTMATATGRRGWQRAAAHLGWRPHMHTFYKRLGS